MLRSLFCTLTGYRYAYRIRLIYKCKLSSRRADVTMNCYLTTPNLIDNPRAIKVVLAPILIGKIPKNYLTNGEIFMEPVCYLGLIKKC